MCSLIGGFDWYSGVSLRDGKMLMGTEQISEFELTGFAEEFNTRAERKKGIKTDF